MYIEQEGQTIPNALAIGQNVDKYTNSTADVNVVYVYDIDRDSAQEETGDIDSSIDETKYYLWNENNVLIWLKKHFLKNEFELSIIQSFLDEFKMQNVTGNTLLQLRNDQLSADELMSNFSKENQSLEIWTLIKSLVSSLGETNDVKSVV